MSGLDRLFIAECDAADADFRARELELHTFGYGRHPMYRPGAIVGLCESGLCASQPMTTHQLRVPSMGGQT